MKGEAYNPAYFVPTEFADSRNMVQCSLCIFEERMSELDVVCGHKGIGETSTSRINPCGNTGWRTEEVNDHRVELDAVSNTMSQEVGN